MKKETKDYQLKVRVTESFRRKIIDYCEHMDMTVSELLRLALEKYLEIREDENESGYN